MGMTLGIDGHLSLAERNPKIVRFDGLEMESAVGCLHWSRCKKGAAKESCDHGR